jgi:hypothetical protein
MGVPFLKEYSDYAGIVKRYLQNYNQLKVTVLNLEDEKNAKIKMLEEYSIPIAKYGEQTSGKTVELNQTEAAADRRLKIKEEIETANTDIMEIKRLLSKLDRAINGLIDVEHRLIVGYFIEGKSWRDLGIEMYYTEKWAREKGNKAIHKIAFMMFGSAAQSQNLRFVFCG